MTRPGETEIWFATFSDFRARMSFHAWPRSVVFVIFGMAVLAVGFVIWDEFGPLQHGAANQG